MNVKKLEGKTDMDFSNIDQKALEKHLIEFRRKRHKYPENAWTEFLTTSDIIKELDALGIPYINGKEIVDPEYRWGVPDDAYLENAYNRALAEGADPDLLEKMKGGYTGAVAVIDSGKPGPTIAIRCDIDCNDVIESSDPEHFPVKEGFASVHPKLMHGCGHDFHATIGIGVCTILSKNKDKFNGKVLLCFQPAEEGARGGEAMSKSGILKDVDYLFGGHIAGPTIKLGEFAAGMMNGSESYKVDLNFKGKSAHAGASPEEGHNALAAAANAILNGLAISRHSGGRTRVNFGACEAGPGRNAIPEYANLKAEVRGITPELNDYMYDRLLRVARASAEMYECELETKIMGHSIDCPSDEFMMDIAKKCAKYTEGITYMSGPYDMGGGGEDVTFMMKEVQNHGGKANFMWIGANTNAPHHNGRFSPDERCLIIATRLYCNMVEALGKIS